MANEKVYLMSLGCDKNLVDSEVMLGLLHEKGYILTDEPDTADAIVINTCGFITDATNESISSVMEMKEYKESGCCKALVLTGCMVTRYKDDIFAELPEVDAILGVNDYSGICGAIEKALETGERQAYLSDIDINAENMPRISATPGYFAYLKIAEGCDNFCTYCTIPSIRGKYRSRDMDSLVAEAAQLAEGGAKELIFVAQDTARYGEDLYGKPELHTLMRRISGIDGIEWIRILYAYPEHITEETISEMASNPKVCRYIDIPLQHSEDRILKLMGRRTTRGKLAGIISRLREQMPDISLRTTVMVGFPGETDEDFQGLLDFLKKAEFDKLGAIMYSREENTPAYNLPGQVPQKVKKARLKQVMGLQQSILKNRCLVGKTFRVIVDGYEPSRSMYRARSYMDAYEIDGSVLFKCEYDILSGQFVDVRITKAEIYDLIGELIE